MSNSGKTLVIHTVGSNNPNVDGKDAARTIALSKGELKVNNPNPTSGGAHVRAV
ncbi:MAG: hypothetical protein ACRECV_14275 [Xanthobacteraceae bacterium]